MTLFNPILRGKPPSSLETVLIELHAFTSQPSNSLARFDDVPTNTYGGLHLDLKEKLVHARTSRLPILMATFYELSLLV